jgi:hypothetical protein
MVFFLKPARFSSTMGKMMGSPEVYHQPERD